MPSQPNNDTSREEIVNFSGTKQRESLGEIYSNTSKVKTSPSLISISDPELSAKTGIFINSVTGTTWVLSLKDERLIVDVPNFSFQISPLTLTRFIPANTSVKMEIEFEKQGQQKPLLMHVYTKGVKRATFEAIVER